MSEAKEKISNFKDLIEKLMAEDPIIAGVFILVFVPLTPKLVAAVVSGDINTIFMIIAVFCGVTIFVCIPLIITKNWRIAFSRKVKKQEKREASEYKRKEQIEVNKQKRFNELLDAKIAALKSEMAFILDKSETYDRYVMRMALEDITKGLKGNLDKINFVNKTEFKETLGLMIGGLRKTSTQYDTLLNQIQDLSDAIDLEAESEAETKPGPCLNPETEVSEKTVLKERAPIPGWKCNNCNRINSIRSVKCKQCNTSQANI